MRDKRPRILAVNPGSRYLGLAVFIGPTLYEWGIKVVRGRDAREKAAFVRNVVEDRLARFGTNVLALKKLHPSRSSSTLRRIVSEVQRIAKKRAIMTREWSIGEIKTKLLDQERGNKRQIVEEVASRYPFLSNEIERQSNSDRSYLTRVFEAVALGIVCFNAWEGGRRKVGSKMKSTER